MRRQCLVSYSEETNRDLTVTWDDCQSINISECPYCKDGQEQIMDAGEVFECDNCEAKFIIEKRIDIFKVVRDFRDFKWEWVEDEILCDNDDKCESSYFYGWTWGDEHHTYCPECAESYGAPVNEEEE